MTTQTTSLQPNEVEIFKAGIQRSSTGYEHDYTDDELESSVNTYNELVATKGDTHKAPVIIGHTHKDDTPAYAWVDKLAFDKSKRRVVATLGQISDKLKTVVSEGMYKKCSAGFHTPTSPSNPAPGNLLLRHLAMTNIPAVKGMEPITVLHSAPAGEVLEYGDWDDVQSAGLMRSLREWILGKFGQDEADKALPGFVVSSLEVSAAMPEADETPAFAEATVATTVETPAAPDTPAAVVEAPAADFAETTTPATPVGQEAAAAPAATVDFAEKEAKLAARESELAEREEAVRAAEIENFCEGLIAEGRVVPGLKNTVTTLLKTLGQAGSIEFAEGEEKPAADLLKELLSSLPKAVHYGEVATDVSGPAPEHVDFAVAPGFELLPADREKLQRAQAYMTANPGTSLTQAYSKI